VVAVQQGCLVVMLEIVLVADSILHSGKTVFVIEARFLGVRDANLEERLCRVEQEVVIIIEVLVPE
jgi:hypothetical protein